MSPAQLQAANGLVRCGSCLGVFSASANEIRVKPEPIVEPSASNEEAQHTFDSDIDPSTENVIEPAAWQETDEVEVTLGDMNLLFEYEEEEDEANDQHETLIPPEEIQALPVVQSAEQTTDAAADDDTHKETEEDEERWIAENLDQSSNISAQPTVDIAEERIPEEPQGQKQVINTSAPPLVKQTLHNHLSELRDTDELAPADDLDLEHLEAVPITLTNKSALHSRFTRITLVLVNLLLLLALPAQWLYQNRNTLATHPRYAFLSPSVCSVVSCRNATIAPSKSPLYSQQLLVRSHPRYANALEVSFIFYNDSATPQAFPNIELAFSDVDNVPIANRLFSPTEYLPPELQQLSAMPAKTSVQVVLELQDPGKEAVNYTLKIHDRQP